MELPFHALLYRYFFFAWLFKDLNQRDLLARAAAWRYNKGQAHWLPLYIRRYLVSGALLFALGWLIEQASPLLSAFFYLPSVMSVPLAAVAGVAWIGFQVWD
ncbi:hypothetical protein [Polaromonas sp.]|uniref:hypothetical protein n=1 Tax=Polaromonas sp. TaxID=1869339 RepID=UPI002FC6EE63